MGKSNNQKTEPTEYKHVKKVTHLSNGSIKYRLDIQFGNRTASKTYDHIREAAIAADVYLIKNGKQPVNILKPKI